MNSILSRTPYFSLNNTLLRSPMCQTLTPGPLIVPLPEVPKRPAAGAPYAVPSNHRVIERCPSGRLPSRSWSGRMVTDAGVVLAVNAVPVGSDPVHSGVRKFPENQL